MALKVTQLSIGQECHGILRLVNGKESQEIHLTADTLFAFYKYVSDVRTTYRDNALSRVLVRFKNDKRKEYFVPHGDKDDVRDSLLRKSELNIKSVQIFPCCTSEASQMRERTIDANALTERNTTLSCIPLMRPNDVNDSFTKPCPFYDAADDGDSLLEDIGFENDDESL